MNDAFLKFISISTEMRTIFRQELNEKMKKVLMLFCDPNGQMINENSIDLITLGKVMN